MLSAKCGSKFTVIFLIVTGLLLDVNSQSSCRTPEMLSGVCVPILTCDPITQLLSSSRRPLPPTTVQFVQQSHCGTFDGVHYVCCKKTSLTGRGTAELVTTRKSTLKSNADVRSGMAILESLQCGKSEGRSNLEVANGENANLQEYPWLALLIYDDGKARTLDCGGSLITDRYVLTAAHCIRVGSKKLVSVRLGEHDTSTPNDCSSTICAPPVQEIDIEEAVYHTDYSPSQFSDDIGLIRLISRAIFRSNVQPICLPLTRESQTMTLYRLEIAGWGRVETGVQANVLQKAQVPVKGNDVCQNIHRVVQITDKHLCAGGDNQIDTCKGDSGGPIIRGGVRSVQYGIVSAGSSQCGSMFPGLYVRITSYLPWIAGNIRP